MSLYEFKLNDRVENVRTGERGIVVGLSRCTFEIFVLYDGVKQAKFENPADMRKVTEQ
jgi:hypothetical protein